MTEITIEVDDIHSLMFEELSDGEIELEEWAEDALEQLVYQAYQNREE